MDRRPRTTGTVLALVALACALASPMPALARDYAGIVVDAATGRTLYEDRADAVRFPASLTKMMTLRLAFEAMERGALSPDDPVTFSARAAAAPPSKVGVAAGRSIPVREAVDALVVKSANDAAVALCETLYDTEERCAWAMTLEARRLGMASTVFRNASGLPDRGQVTTARDMARLGLSLRRDHPDRFASFAKREAVVGGRTFRSHNKLLGRVRGVDGIKTGYIRASGYNLVTSVERDGRSVVAVVIGGRTGASRDAHMRDLLSRTFRYASRGDGYAAGLSGPMVPAEGLAVAELLPEPTTGDDGPYRTTAMAFAPEPDRTGAAAAVTGVVRSDDNGTPAPRTGQESAVVPGDEGSDAQGGWMVQVAAAPTERGAREMMEDAKRRLPSLLARAERVVVGRRGGRTYHQARFVGFDTSREAVEACRSLERAGGDCYSGKG